MLQPDVGNRDGATYGIAGALVLASEEGSVTGLAASQPGVVAAEGSSGAGFAVLGLGPEASLVSLDGLNLGLGAMPRDARIAVRMSTSPFDVARGGFSSAELALSTVSGDNIRTKLLRATFAPASFQVGGGTQSRLAPRSRTIVSGAMAGPIHIDHSYYSWSAQLEREEQPVAALASLTAAELSDLGVVSRELKLVEATLRQRSSADLLASGDRIMTAGSSLLRLDRGVLDSGHVSVALGLHATDASILTGRATSLSLAGGASRTAGATALVTSERYVHDVLNELRIGVRTDWQSNRPRDASPRAVILFSQPNGPGLPIDIGGGDASVFRSSTRAFDGQEQLTWRNATRDQVVKLGLQGHAERAAVTSSTQSLGQYAYDDVDAFLANRPSSFYRSAARGAPNADLFSLSPFIGSTMSVWPRLSIQGGVRLDAQGLRLGSPSSAPAARLAIARPSHVASFDVSPRVGFTFTYGQSRTSVLTQTSIHGGVGRFVGNYSLGAGLGASAIDVPLASGELRCSDSLITAPGWTTDPLTPARQSPCISAATTLPPRISVVAPNLAPMSSWRSTLGWAGVLSGRVSVTVDGTYSMTSRVPGVLERNMPLGPAFVLGGEANRPVFTGADRFASSGAVVLPSRVDSSVGRASALLSDLGSRALQGVVTIRTDIPHFANVKIGYAATAAREQTRGYDGTTSGDPTVAEWSPASLAAPHAFNLQLAVPLGTAAHIGVFVLKGRYAAGRRFTPLIAGDVNGDGQSLNDRAYIPVSDANDSLQGLPFVRLLPQLTSSVSSCLLRQAGRIAARNSCQSSATSVVDASVSLRAFTGLIPRTTLDLSVLNVGALADVVLHGASGIRGWGQSHSIDPIFETATSFNVTDRRFVYRLNSHFGRELYSALLPFQVRIDFKIGLGRDNGAQRIALDSARKSRPNAATLLARYVRRFPDPARATLLLTDSLHLSRMQFDSLNALQNSYQSRMNNLWRPVAEFVAGHFDDVRASAGEVREAETASAEIYATLALTVRSLLTPGQMGQVSEQLDILLDPRFPEMMGILPPKSR